MRQVRCEACGNAVPLASCYRIGEVASAFERSYCEPCAKRQVAGREKAGLRVRKEVDPTVCGLCQTDCGSTELPLAGHMPTCPACREKIYNRPFPHWLKAALVVTLALLAVALIHGRTYFSAERDLLRAERLVGQKRDADAVPLLRRALAVAPDCERCILLTSKAELLSGAYSAAYARLQRHRHFKTTELAEEVKGIVGRVGASLAMAEKAEEAYKAEKWDMAAKLMGDASAGYPEDAELAEAAAAMRAAAAFERKDFDQFLAISRGMYDRWHDWVSAEELSSALACKYALGGDPDARARSEAMMAKAHDLAVAAKTDMKEVSEFEERTRYRLSSREILSPEEYDRRFRAHPGKEQ